MNETQDRLTLRQRISIGFIAVTLLSLAFGIATWIQLGDLQHPAP